MKITHRPSPKPGQASAANVPQEVKDIIDEQYAYLRTHENDEGFGEFDSTDERADFVKNARAYCETREAGLLTFRILPSKNLPATQIRFSLKANLPANAAMQNGTATPDPKSDEKSDAKLDDKPSKK